MTKPKKEPSLEERLRELQKVFKEDLKVFLIIKNNGQIILGNVISKSFLDYENEEPDDDEGSLDHTDKINPMSMKMGDYIG